MPVADIPDAGREDSALAAVDSAATIRQILESLPPKQRAAVALRYLADLGDEEIGALLGCSASTVRSQLARGLAKLRREVNDA